MKKSNSGEERSSDPGEQKIAAIGYLIAGKTVAETATILKIAPSTIRQWHKQADFIVQLNASRQDAFHANMERLRSMAPKALQVLEKGLASKNEVTRLRVAELVLKTVKLTEIPNPTGPVTIDEFDRDQAYRTAMTNVLDAF